MSEAVAQHLDESLERLKTNGWAKHEMASTTGAQCALGAVFDSGYVQEGGRLALKNNIRSDDAYAAIGALRQAVPEYEGRPVWPGARIVSVADYNNSREDFGEIEVWFKQAAANERADA